MRFKSHSELQKGIRGRSLDKFKGNTAAVEAFAYGLAEVWEKAAKGYDRLREQQGGGQKTAGRVRPTEFARARSFETQV